MSYESLDSYPHLTPSTDVREGLSRDALFAIYGRPRDVPHVPGGTIALVDFMGDDQAIVQSARTSYGREVSEHKWRYVKDDADGRREYRCGVCRSLAVVRAGSPDPGEEGHPDVADNHCIEGDRRLIRYLVSHRHTTPIEACELKVHVKLPIFVERQWARHRTASWNEVSARYTTLDQGYYVPTHDRLRQSAQSTSNKQGSEAADWGAVAVADFADALHDEVCAADNQYRARIDAGMARELARVNMPVSAFTTKVWKIDLHNLVHFLGLRVDRHAQFEIRQYANMIAMMVRDWCPLLWEAVYDYRLEAAYFSRMERDVLRCILHGAVTPPKSADPAEEARFVETVSRELARRGCSKREIKAFMAKIDFGGV